MKYSEKVHKRLLKEILERIFEYLVKGKHFDPFLARCNKSVYRTVRMCLFCMSSRVHMDLGSQLINSFFILKKLSQLFPFLPIKK